MNTKVGMRLKVYDMIEPSNQEGSTSKSFGIYDCIMMVSIIASLVPLAFKSTNRVFEIIDIVTVIIFIIDYVIRFFTADFAMKKGYKSFFIYPLTPMAILDLFTILPSLTIVSNGFKLFKLVRLLRTFRVLRAFKAFRYSSSIKTILNVFKKQKDSLTVVCVMAASYVLISALIVFNVEPDSFGNFFDAVYWATVSLTTMGYGDIYPITVAGRLVTMISSFMGIAIVALPAGIITSGFMLELEGKLEKKSDAEK